MENIRQALNFSAFYPSVALTFPTSLKISEPYFATPSHTSRANNPSTMKDPAIENTIDTNPFKRLIFMALFFGLFGIARLLLWVLVVFQLLAHMLTGRVTAVGVRWGKALSNWIHKMLLFMSYNTEQMPFPFAAFGVAADED